VRWSQDGGVPVAYGDRMLRRRLVWLLVLLAAVAAGAAQWRRRHAVSTVRSAAPTWPPLDPPSPLEPPPPSPGPADAPVVPEPTAADPGEHVPDDATGPTWRAPVDGACPPGYPVKVKLSSGIYHVPGGRFYDRTAPDRCYADPAAAEADGYRASKS
jgi:hypothetical protein